MEGAQLLGSAVRSTCRKAHPNRRACQKELGDYAQAELTKCRVISDDDKCGSHKPFEDDDDVHHEWYFCDVEHRRWEVSVDMDQPEVADQIRPTFRSDQPIPTPDEDEGTPDEYFQ